MGWTYYHKPSNVSAEAALREELSWSHMPEEKRPTIVASAKGSGVIAFAVKYPGAYFADHKGPRKTIPNEDGSETIAVVFLHKSVAKDRHNFGYKDMDEFSGPYEAAVSASILKHLSPLNPEFPYDSVKWAQGWRDKCAAYSAGRAKAKALKPGAKLTLAAPLNFKSFKADEFVAESYTSKGKSKLGFRAVGAGVLCRLPARVIAGATIS